MSTVNNGPQIVRSGLILDLDAGYMRSYSPNVVPYPTDLFAWCGAAATNSCTISRDTTITRQYGSTPMKMTVTGTDPYVDTINSTIWSLAPAVIGQTWTMSVYAKASASTTGELLIFGADSSGSIVDFDFVTINITNSWTRFSLTYTLVDSACAFIQIRLDGTPTFGSGINIWWDGLQVERASAATNFNPYYIGNTVWKDVSGNNNNGTINGAIFNSANGGSIVFDGLDDHVTVTNNETLRLNDITVEAWIYIAANPSDWVRICGVGSAVGTANNRMYGLWYNGTNSSANRNLLWQRYSPDVAIYATSTILSLNTWYHVVATTNGSSHVLYLNTTSIGTVTGAGPWTANTLDNITMCYAGFHTYHNGRASMIRIYNRALTAAEVSQNYEATKTRFGL